MAGGGNVGMRVTSVLALSLGPFLVMADIVSVMIVKKEIVIGFGAPGQVFPSFLGLAGFFCWFGGLFFLRWSKKVRKRTISSMAAPYFLKGKKGFKCAGCGQWIDASNVEYHEMITCSCGKNYDVFQEGPWDEEGINEGERSSPSKAPRSPKGNGRPVKRPVHRRSR
jgi:hypothetical protein